jgi:hypothetical protein
MHSGNILNSDFQTNIHFGFKTKRKKLFEYSINMVLIYVNSPMKPCQTVYVTERIWHTRGTYSAELIATVFKCHIRVCNLVVNSGPYMPHILYSKRRFNLPSSTLIIHHNHQQNNNNIIIIIINDTSSSSS